MYTIPGFSTFCKSPGKPLSAALDALSTALQDFLQRRFYMQNGGPASVNGHRVPLHFYRRMSFISRLGTCSTP